MQDELIRHNPSLNSMILGVNEIRQESGNNLITEKLPMLQDVDANADGKSDVWTSWNVQWRDVKVVNRANDEVYTINLTLNSLSIADNYNTLKQQIINAGRRTPTSPYQSPIEPLDVNKDGFVSPIDALLVINELGKHPNGRPADPAPGTTPNAYIDPNGDGFVTPVDPLLIINHLTKMSRLDARAPLSGSASEDDPQPMTLVRQPLSGTTTSEFLETSAPTTLSSEVETNSAAVSLSQDSALAVDHGTTNRNASPISFRPIASYVETREELRISLLDDVFASL